MKYFAVFTLVIFVLILGCSDGQHFGEKKIVEDNTSSGINMDEINAFEGYRMVADMLYTPAFTDEEYERLYTFLQGIEQGSIFTNAQTGIGTVNNGVAAGAILQSLYYTVSDDSKNSTGTYTALYPMLEKETFSDNDTFNNFMQSIETFDNTQLNTLLTPVTVYQDTLLATVEKFLPNLLDVSSSASKGSDANIITILDEYSIIANAAYVFASPMLNESTAAVNNVSEISSILSDSLYNLSKNAKYKNTYSKSVKYFKDNFMTQIAPADDLALYNNVSKDTLAHDGKVGGEPYKNDANDAVLTANPYNEDTTDNGLYPVIAKRLYGAPFDPYGDVEDVNTYTLIDNNPASNLAVNNTLEFYQKLKTIGLKVPAAKTSLVGHKTLADIIAENLKDNNIIYQNFNDSTNFTANVMNVMFPATITEASPVCIMIKEFNTAVDNSALSHADNAGVFDPSFDSNNYNPCNITVN